MSYYFGNNHFAGYVWANNAFHGPEEEVISGGPIALPVLEDILAHRPRSLGRGPGGQTANAALLSHNFIELAQGKPVLMTFVEPDPNTTHAQFYYHTRENQLYKRMLAADSRYIWKLISSN